MGQPKTKICAFDTRAREVKPGVWEWSVNGFVFRWEDRRAINTAMDTAGELRWLAHTRSLAEAVVFSWGVWTGLRDTRLARERT